MVRFIILQLTAFQKENLKMRCDLEREITARQTLQLQLESKEQLVGSLKSQLEARSASGLLTATDNSSLLASGASRLSTHELVSPRAVSAHGTRGCLCTRHARPSVYMTRAAVCATRAVSVYHHVVFATVAVNVGVLHAHLFSAARGGSGGRQAGGGQELLGL